MHQPTLSAQTTQAGTRPVFAAGTVPLQPAPANQSTAESQPSMMLCCYQNRSPKIQIIRSAEGERQRISWHLERVIFPGQRLLFEAPHQSRIHVYSSEPAGMLVDDTVPCDRIQVQDQ